MLSEARNLRFRLAELMPWQGFPLGTPSTTTKGSAFGIRRLLVRPTAVFPVGPIYFGLMQSTFAACLKAQLWQHSSMHRR